MRDIRIRAWNKEEKRWFIFENASLYEKEDGPNTVLIVDFSDNYVVEQYTGLKDKNGKEIYEGDIAQDSKGAKCMVEWNTGEAHFGLYVGKQMELTDFIWMRGEDLEVIGNIHENPELLETKK